MSTDKHDIKVAVLGASCSGKSSFVERIVNNDFPVSRPSQTIGVNVDFWRYDDNRVIFYDTGAIDSYNPVIQKICVPCKLFLVMFDAGAAHSLKEAITIVHRYKPVFPKAKFALIATKVDTTMIPDIDRYVARNCAGIQLYKVSAKVPKLGSPERVMKHIIATIDQAELVPYHQPGWFSRYFDCFK